MKTVLLWGCLAAVGLCTGCGTILMRAADPGEELYPATQGDILMFHGCLHPDGTIFARRTYVGAGLTVLDMPVSVATDSVLFPFDWWRCSNLREQRLTREREAAAVKQIIAEIRTSPSVIFQKGWHLSDDPLTVRAVTASFRDPGTCYSAEMLERLYVEAPRYRPGVLANPACPPHLLVDHFQEAYERAGSASYEMLAAIVSNPNTPTELVEKVATSQTIPVGAVYPARKELKRRQAGQHE